MTNIWHFLYDSVQCVRDTRRNMMAYGEAREGKWRGNWRMEWVASSTLHTTSEHGVSSITTTDAHTSAASSRLNWRPLPIEMDSSVSPKDELWFLHVCHHISTGLYKILSKYVWLLIILTSCSTTCCLSCDSSRTNRGTSATSSGEKIPLNTSDTCIEGADDDADTMAIPPAPFIIRESVPAAGCNSAENSSVFSERYLKQKESHWFQIKCALCVFTAYSKRFRTASTAQIQTLPAWTYAFHISFQSGYRSDALSV